VHHVLSDSGIPSKAIDFIRGTSVVTTRLM
jgi:hypothetical protein